MAAKSRPSSLQKGEKGDDIPKVVGKKKREKLPSARGKGRKYMSRLERREVAENNGDGGEAPKERSAFVSEKKVLANSDGKGKIGLVARTETTDLRKKLCAQAG